MVGAAVAVRHVEAPAPFVACAERADDSPRGRLYDVARDICWSAFGGAGLHIDALRGTRSKVAAFRVEKNFETGRARDGDCFHGRFLDATISDDHRQAAFARTRNVGGERKSHLAVARAVYD